MSYKVKGNAVWLHGTSLSFHSLFHLNFKSWHISAFCQSSRLSVVFTCVLRLLPPSLSSFTVILHRLNITYGESRRVRVSSQTSLKHFSPPSQNANVKTQKMKDCRTNSFEVVSKRTSWRKGGTRWRTKVTKQYRTVFMSARFSEQPLLFSSTTHWQTLQKNMQQWSDKCPAPAPALPLGLGRDHFHF